MESQSQNTKSMIQDYYNERASTDHYATSPDFNLREIEIQHLTARLTNGLRVLDVGCGNGYSTLCHAARFDSDFVGVDFVPAMIDAAGEIANQFDLTGRAAFDTGDVMDLQFDDAQFNVVISQRCLLNLPTADDQWKAMGQIARVLKPGGLYLMLEGTLQGLRRLNDARQAFGLEPIPEAAADYNWFSNKFDEPEMLRVAEGLFDRLETVDRFGMYYFISRVIHPLMVAPDQPKYDAHINAVAQQICARIPNYQDMGHVALFVFRR